MTEQQWLTTDQVTWLLCHAEAECSARKLARFQLECARPLVEADDDPELSNLYQQTELALAEATPPLQVEMAIAATGRYAERSLGLLLRAIEEARGRKRSFIRAFSQRAVAAYLMHDALSPEGWWRVTTDIDEGPELARYQAFEMFREVWCQQNIPLLRCIVGNPFRPVAFDPEWRSETTVALAGGIYAERAFDRLPILADALEEAGCDHPDILAHCRGPGPHARGCWVVDGVLGK